MNEIIYIKTSQIEPHPDNPRKDVGDISDLAQSIAVNGIMQNLTVLLTDNSADGSKKYRALIGHRRLAAAKAAGLESVPCVIAPPMTDKEQVAVMLAENMQRSDLTLIEQADGIQMMLDLGDTKDGVTEKTGLSRTTIDRRLKLREYDRKELTEAMERGGTLADYEKISAVKDPEKRNELLKAVGTNDFAWKLKSAVQDENDKINAKKNHEMLESFAEFTEKPQELNLIYVKLVSKQELLTKPNDTNTTKYYYTACSYDEKMWYLYRGKTAEEIAKSREADERNKAYQEERARKAAAYEKVKEISDRAYELRCDFVRKGNFLKDCNLQYRQLEKYKLACSYMLRAIADDSLGLSIGLDPECLGEFMGIDVTEGNVADKIIEQHIPEIRCIITAIFLSVGKHEQYCDFAGRYNCNRTLDFIYEMLCDFGYVMSDEEKALQDSTHEWFAQKEDGQA